MESSLPFGRIGITRPETVPRTFHVYAAATETTDRGRDKKTAPALVCKFRGIMARASPEEQLQFSQLGTVVTHTIIQRGLPLAGENNMLMLIKNGKPIKRFRIQNVHDKGGLGIDTVYYCQERSDLTICELE
jgi:hypothetical protein